MSGLRLPRSYDAWKLASPYEGPEPPPWVEDLLGSKVEVDGYEGVVEDYECWEDADEDGRHGGVDLVARFPLPSGRSFSQNMSRTEVEEALVGE